MEEEVRLLLGEGASEAPVRSESRATPSAAARKAGQHRGRRGKFSSSSPAGIAAYKSLDLIRRLRGARLSRCAW